jgi:hypothetical protein
MVRSSERTQRAYIRHPSRIPIEITAAGADGGRRRLRNVGFGGLACESARPLPPGAVVSVRIPNVLPPFETRAKVVWCREHGAGYEVGVQFAAPEDAYAARMVEQICHIEDYRNRVRETEGRALDEEQAALEWISKHAKGFPGSPA